MAPSASPADFMCGRWAERVHDVCEAGFGASVHGLRDGTYFNTHGCQFRQLPQDVPALRALYTDWELGFNSIPFVCWSAQNWGVALGVCAAYLLFCFGGTQLMASRKPFDLKPLLAAWNLFLALFSLAGFLRTMPHLVYYLLSDPAGLSAGFYASVCRPAETSFGQGANGFWTMLFIFSKVPELIDTLFVVLRKKELIFLHWYHHVTVLLYCWHSYMTRSSAGLYFVAMNFGVHALMYFYFFLQSIGVRVGWAQVVTTLQISQMFVGIIVCTSVALFQLAGKECDMTRSNFIAGLVMYLSYLMLFLWFAVEKYCFSKKSEKKKLR